MIQFGLRLHDAEKLPMEQLLPLVRQKGFTCAHLALSKAMKEYPCTPSALTPGYALYLRRLFDQNDIAVLGNYLNLAHPDEGALAAIQEKYYAHIRFASLLGKDIAMIHFKDFLPEDADGQLKATGAGRGGMDYTQTMRFAKREKPFIFGTLESTTPDNAVSCLEFLQKQYDEWE